MVAVGGGTGTAAVDVGCEVVDLLAVLVAHDGATCGAGVSGEHNAILIRNQF
jgi:hypothetical protein